MKINISQIPLIHLESIIPRKLFLKFQYNKFKNVGDVISLDFDEFSQYKGVGKNLLRLLDDFKYLIDKNPQFIIQAYEKSIESSNISKLPQINKIEIKYIKSIIPNKLYKKLERYGIDNIESFSKIDKEDFKKFM